MNNKMNNPYGAIERVNIINELLGKNIVAIENKDNYELHFIDEENTHYIFYHEQDCCEIVEIEDICGDLFSLLNTPITMAEEVIHESLDDEYSDMAKDLSTTYTFYKFATVNGYVTVRWCGSSNGYYSERVDFKVEHPQKEMTM